MWIISISDISSCGREIPRGKKAGSLKSSSSSAYTIGRISNKHNGTSYVVYTARHISNQAVMVLFLRVVVALSSPDGSLEETPTGLWFQILCSLQ